MTFANQHSGDAADSSPSAAPKPADPARPIGWMQKLPAEQGWKIAAPAIAPPPAPMPKPHNALRFRERLDIA